MWEILSGLGGIAGIVALLILLKGTPRQWRIQDWIRKRADVDQVLILLADLEFDTDGRWTGDISEELARLKKRQRRLGRPIRTMVDKQGKIMLDGGVDALRRHGCDILIAGRVAPDGKSAIVKIMNRHDGILDEVTLRGEKGDKRYVEQLAQFNLSIEEGIARNMDKEGLLGEGSYKGLTELEITKTRLNKFHHQAIHPKSERYAEINRAALNIKLGDEQGSAQFLRDARDTMKTAHEHDWYGEEDNSAAVQVANTLVFEARIDRDEEKLKQARDWYRKAAQQALAVRQYEQWITAYNGMTWTAVEIYLSNGEKSWLETAREEQISALETCREQLEEEQYTEAIEVMAGIRLAFSTLEGDEEEILEAVEEVKTTGRYDILAQVNSVGGSSIARKLMLGAFDEVEYWSKECARVDRDAEPQQWALAQNRKGIALAEVAERSGNVEQLIEGERAVRDALNIWTEERWPLKYALAMDNLGLMLKTRYYLTGNREILKDAIQAHENAIEYRSRGTAVREWISTVRNMASSLIAFAEAYGDSGVASRAVSILREAKEECRRLKEKYLELEVTLNLGLAFGVLAELSGNGDYVDDAIEALQTGIEGVGETLGEGKRQAILKKIEKLRSMR